jgi:hypothetical protein
MSFPPDFNMLGIGLPNGLAQRQRRDERDSTTIIAYSSKSRLRGAAEPLSDWSRCWAALFKIVHLLPIEANIQSVLLYLIESILR